MTKFTIGLAPAAEQDIADAFLWYSERNATAADGFRAETVEAIDYIAAKPLSKAEDVEGNRKWVLKHFPYSVIYEVNGYVSPSSLSRMSAENQATGATNRALSVYALISCRTLLT